MTGWDESWMPDPKARYWLATEKLAVTLTGGVAVSRAAEAASGAIDSGAAVPVPAGQSGRIESRASEAMRELDQRMKAGMNMKAG